MSAKKVFKIRSVVLTVLTVMVIATTVLFGYWAYETIVIYRSSIVAKMGLRVVIGDVDVEVEAQHVLVRLDLESTTGRALYVDEYRMSLYAGGDFIGTVSQSSGNGHRVPRSGVTHITELYSLKSLDPERLRDLSRDSQGIPWRVEGALYVRDPRLNQATRIPIEIRTN